jgi:hypothetical protein
MRATLLAEMQAQGGIITRQCALRVVQHPRSELELWGHNEAFDHPSLPAAVLQHAVHTVAGTFILDRAYLEEMVGVELDGAAWHGSAPPRERDVRRDAALAAAALAHRAVHPFEAEPRSSGLPRRASTHLHLAPAAAPRS